MKKNVLIIVLLCSSVVFSQKTKNGTVYKDHPAIATVESMLNAFFMGDKAKTSGYLSEDFKSYSGNSLDKDDKGRDKENFLGGVDWVQKNLSYISHDRSPGAYPDAIEYKEKDDGLWVQTWNQLRAMDNKTGVKLDMPIHRLFKMTNDNKIQMMITYDNDLPWAEMGRSYAARTNGTIYNNHDYINTVRKMMGSLEHGDADKAFSYFTEDATFTNLDMERGTSKTVAEEKAMFKGLTEAWNIDSVDVVGYPDYLEYELGNGKVVQSWWNLRLTRKSDNKKVVIPVLLIHSFNDEGKIIRESGYYTAMALAQK